MARQGISKEQVYSAATALREEGTMPTVQAVRTRLGSGCTSGHGVCGIGRLSFSSIVATLVFLSVGMLTATWLYAS